MHMVMEERQLIKAFWGRKNVTDMPTDISDFLIKVPNTDLKFALKCFSGKENELQLFQAKLMPILQLRGAPNLPVVVTQKTDDGVLSLGVAVSWRFGAPTIESDVKFIALNEGNRMRIYDEIKSSDETIRALEMPNCKVVKHIVLSEEYNGIPYQAEIMYLRDLSITYRMKSRDDLSGIERLNYYLKGIPEEDYPCDQLDKGILKAVREGGYKNSKTVSKLMLFSSELRDLKQVYGNKIPQRVDFLVLPDYSSFSIMEGRSFKPFALDMYVEAVNDYTFQQRHFTIDIPINTVDEYYEFMEGVRTISSVTDFLKRTM